MRAQTGKNFAVAESRPGCSRTTSTTVYFLLYGRTKLNDQGGVFSVWFYNMAKRSAPLIRAIPKQYLDACKNGAEEEKVLIADYRRKFIFQRLSSLVYCWPSSVRHVPYSNGST